MLFPCKSICGTCRINPVEWTNWLDSSTHTPHPNVSLKCSSSTSTLYMYLKIEMYNNNIDSIQIVCSSHIDNLRDVQNCLY